MKQKLLTPQEIDSLLNEMNGKESLPGRTAGNPIPEPNGSLDLTVSDHLILEQVPTFGQFFEAYGDGILIVDKYGRVKRWNQKFSELFGWTSEELKGRLVADLFADRWEYNLFITRLVECKNLSRRRMQFRSNKDEQVEVAVSGWILKDFSGQNLGTVLMLHRDAESAGEIGREDDSGFFTVDQIAEQWRIEMALKKGDGPFRELAAKLPIAVFALRDGRFVFANRAAEAVFGLSWEDLESRTLWELVHPDFERLVKRHCLALSKGELSYPVYEVRLKSSHHVEAWLQLTAACGRYAGESAVVGLALDITDRKVAEECNRYMMFHDLVTGLPNWKLLDLHFKQALDRSKRYDKILGLLNLDLLGIRKLQEAQGDEAAEELLSQVVERIQKCLRKPDVAGRLGADHILIVLEDLKDRQNVSEVAARLLRSLSKPYVMDDTSLSVQMSIGLSVYPFDGLDPNMLIRKADAAGSRI
ncbi:MAG: PAS domain S-box protein [Desulfovibrionales bacterium]